MKTKLCNVVLFLFLIVNSGFGESYDVLSRSEEATAWNMVKNFLSAPDKGDPVRFSNSISIRLTGRYSVIDSMGIVSLISELRTLLPTVDLRMSSARGNIQLRINHPKYEGVVFGRDIRYWGSKSSNIDLQIVTIKLADSLTQIQRDRILAFYLLRSLTGNRANWSSTTVPETIFGQENPLESHFSAFDRFVIQQIYASDFDYRFRKHLGMSRMSYNSTYHPSKWGSKTLIFISTIVLLLIFISMQAGWIKYYLRWQRFVSFWMLLMLPIALFVAMYINKSNYQEAFFLPLISFFMFVNAWFLLELFFVKPSMSFSKALKYKMFIPVILTFVVIILSQIVGGWNSGINFILLYLFISALISAIRMGFHYMRFNSNQEISQRDIELAQLQELKIKAELQAINSRINPHFLYNALNSIATLVHSDPNKTEKMTLALSDFLRYAINRQDVELVSLSEEIEISEKYLEIEKVRFGDRLSYSIVVADDVKTVYVPRFVLQPLVENAVKHGIAPLKDSGFITIKCGIEAEKLSICVFDNGPDFSESLLTGYGLTSLREKLTLIYGQVPELFWVNGDNKHICIKIQIK